MPSRCTPASEVAGLKSSAPRIEFLRHALQGSSPAPTDRKRLVLFQSAYDARRAQSCVTPAGLKSCATIIARTTSMNTSDIKADLSGLIRELAVVPDGPELQDDEPLGLALDSVTLAELLIACEDRWGEGIAAAAFGDPSLTLRTLTDHIRRISDAARKA